ncbi:related to Periodic tryptophan protein 1 [Saccharomycodes ludwigii]|uniref:Related to Periodic tryptophan protein 1 n=1 Tax=Saccharomycodes ludwigii TaxID=36035 RepID=A0A376B4M7_9ASCO|nr:hypothetical protein SCDLUD_000222 [Saccharomycodes ludwigii]KAH3902641.1 hypothetical protein SCDLUD_000222 [Saccharomycodes ludwigii]SSD59646.1 related to Periodic tryptophan protein 1 [Saccharomycodes ludwigii]
MISSTCWVPQGFASNFPERYELNDEEMDRINKMAEQLNLNDDFTKKHEIESDGKKEEKILYNNDEDLKKYDLDHYDDDEKVATTEVNPNFDASILPGLTTVEENGEHYLELPDSHEETNEEVNEEALTLEQDEEKEELQIYPTDNLVLATRTETEGDLSFLDVYVYDDGDENDGFVRESSLYVHHDLMLPAFPLCVEWINFTPNRGNLTNTDNRGNFAAVGTFDPNIEIWNLDCVDKAFPDAILQGHKDAVLSLAHNHEHRNVLASASADSTLKLWDLNSTKAPVSSLNKIHGKKKVSSCEWYDFALLSSGYDSRLAITDVRSTESKYFNIGNGEEIEVAKFSNDYSNILCGTDSGNVYCFDIKNANKPLWTLNAHEGSITSLNVNTQIENLFVTTAMGDKVVKVWNNDNGVPKMVLNRNFGVGNVLTSSFAPDFEVSGNLVVGGVSGNLQLWDAFSNKSVKKAFRNELNKLEKEAISNNYKKFARKYKGDKTQEVLLTAEGLNGNDDDEEEEEEQWEDM